jgi:hypothetical protein
MCGILCIFAWTSIRAESVFGEHINNAMALKWKIAEKINHFFILASLSLISTAFEEQQISQLESGFLCTYGGR